MRTKRALWSLGGLVMFAGVVLFLNGYIPLPFRSNTHRFHIVGDVVDQQGNPLSANVGGGAGQFVSIVQEKYEGHFSAVALNNHFEVYAGPCDIVTIEITCKGYSPVNITYGQMSDVPQPLHIVLRKYMPATMPVSTPANVIGTYVAQGQYMPPSVPYDSMRLEINPNFTLRTEMTVPDRKKTYSGAGTWHWSETFKDRILVTIKWEDGTPTPSRHPATDDRLDVMDPDGHRLMQCEGGPDFFRQPDKYQAPAPAYLVGRYISYGEDWHHLPPWPCLSTEVILNSDWTATVVTTMWDGKTKYTNSGTWMRLQRDMVGLKVNWQGGAPHLPASGQGNQASATLSVLDGGQRLWSDQNAPPFFRVH
jgi:hypothetical protein